MLPFVKVYLASLASNHPDQPASQLGRIGRKYWRYPIVRILRFYLCCYLGTRQHLHNFPRFTCFFCVQLANKAAARVEARTQIRIR